VGSKDPTHHNNLIGDIVLEGRVFLTGGTGSLGTAFLHLATTLDWPCEITVFSRDEVKQSELRSKYSKHRFVLGDVRDYDWLQLCMRGHDLVIHAAAYKQVPTAEVNAGEAIEVNVIGSRNIARAAVFNSIPKVIGISTDKACAPVNCYGETKALMERMFQQACLWDHTDFRLVRYGNVLGSRGSVVPLFEHQAKAGYVTVTAPDMTRFWLTLRQAVQLVLHCYGGKYDPGTILIPKCPSSTMQQLAECFIAPEHIKITGIRAGEKYHEQLVNRSEAIHTDDIGTHFLVYPAYTLHKGNLPVDFEYTSYNAHRLEHYELSEMIHEKLY
jgi:UDP-N-acetylglucosamine 4,6-dehydratase/5-epimerase